MLLKLIKYIIDTLGNAFEQISNDRVRYNLLQAIPFWFCSIVTGLLAVIYAKIFHWGEDIIRLMMAWHSWTIFVISPVCFVFSWWLVYRFAPYAKGSGIPQVMAAIEMSNPKEGKGIKYLLSIKIILIKIVSSLVLVIGGGAVGREGPTIQIAGSVFHKVNEYLPAWWPRVSKRNMIMTGAAAGLAAAFNTPMGGIVFAVEELAKTHIRYFKTALFTAVIVAGLTAQTFAGSYLYFGYPKTQGVTLMVMFPVILVSGVSGVLASKLAQWMLAIHAWKKKLKTPGQNIIFLLLTAFLVAGIAYFISPLILGSGNDLIEKVLFTSDKNEAWYVPLFRMLGPALSFTSGGAGGVFAPALSAGASIGSVVSGWLGITPHESNVVILAGMVGFLTGITRAPFTSSILVLEMTDRHSLVFHLMLAGMVSSLVSLAISRKSLYDVLKDTYLKELT
ncbi:MAG: chloride channel protein [Bergeyella sp.]|nr:chloride channel protein [Bergeyella sp.]